MQLPATPLLVQLSTLFSTIWRRHLPICTTIGMFSPTGTSESVKLPLASVWVARMASSACAPPQVSQLAPAPNAGSASPGCRGT